MRRRHQEVREHVRLRFRHNTPSPPEPTSWVDYLSKRVSGLFIYGSHFLKYQGKEEKEDVQEKRGWKVYEQP
jgi:hypothetical protein